jgi:hypothetical protein
MKQSFFIQIPTNAIDAILVIYGGFLKWGVPLNHPFIDGFSLINHPFLGIPICGNPHMTTPL